MKIYTRTGDDGKTHLCTGPRVAKDDPHVEACGTVDELNAVIGVVRADAIPRDVDELLHRIQHELFGIGADLAMRGPAAGNGGLTEQRHVDQLEHAIDAFEAQLSPLAQFILPGGERPAALLHLARTVCRRAERCVVGLARAESQLDATSPIIRYLNRLSDLLFVLPRVLNKRAEVRDEGWRQEST